VNSLLSNVGRDVRYSLRTLRKTPAFTLGAIVTVALTVGATTAIFSIVYGVLLRQLPYRDPDRVFWIWSDQPGRDRTPFNVPDFIDYRDSTQALAGFAGYFTFSANLSDEAAAERIQGLRATPNLFEVLGARVRLGRLLQPADEQPGSDHVVVLTQSCWLRRFAGDRSVVGREIRLNGESYVVSGVLASGFATPIRDVEFVVPFVADRDPRRGARNSFNFIHAVGRLSAHVSAAQANGELNAIARRLQQEFPVENARKRGVRMVRLVEGVAGQFRTALLTLFGAVAAVLLAACANLANLMLTRAAGRRKEFAVQLALGSSRAGVVRQVLVEALLVSAVGGAVGVLIAHWSATGLMTLAPSELPRSGDVRLDLTVLLFSLAASTLTGVVFGAVPAFVSAGVDVRDALHASGRGTTIRNQRVRGLLISSEVTLAVALLTAMAMLGKSFANVQAVSPGFDPSGVLSARLTLPAARFNSREAIVTFQRALGQRIAAMPDVTASGAISLLPLSGLLSRVPFTVEGRPIDRERVPLAQFRTVTAGYFEAMRIPLKRGRTFNDRDTETTRPVAVVNEQLARQWLNGVEPVGARLLVDDNDGLPRPVEIVGVVGNVQQMALDGDPTWDLYLAYPQIHADNVGAAAANMFWIVRTAGDPTRLAPTIAREVRRVDPEVAASQIRPVESYLGDALASRRFNLWLMAAFAFAAMALAITGIYAVIAYSVSQRAREIGIRVALGARRSHIVRLIVGHGARFVAIGLAAGVMAAIGVARLISTMLFGVTPGDPMTFAQVITVVATASAMACLVPALRIDQRVESVRAAE